MSFFKSDDEKKADKLGRDLVPQAIAGAAKILERLEKQYKVGLRNPGRVLEFQVELSIFWMHLIDRIVFRQVETARWDKFMIAFIVAVIGQTVQQIPDIPAHRADQLRKAMLNDFNRRQTEYR